MGEYELRGVIGAGGFGIVYLAFDHGLEREVAIKEYMPAALASRTHTLHVSLSTPSNAETFALGLRSFVNEARLLARFDHPSLIKVHRFWEERHTAYMVMPLLRGRTVRELREADPRPVDEAWLRRLLDPLLGALEVLHREAVYHRDIAPDNVVIGDDGVPVLLDFGAARHVITGRSQTLTAILKPSYAPIEQYGEAGSLRQGPWTDIYALGAMLHYLLTGAPPAPATARMVHDEALPLAATERFGVSQNFQRVVDWMLAPRPADRPQAVADVRDALNGRTEPPVRMRAVPPSEWQRTVMVPREPAVPTTPPTSPAEPARAAPQPPPPPSPPSTPRPAPVPAPGPGPSTQAKPSPYAPRPQSTWGWPVIGAIGAGLAALVAAVLLWPRAPAPKVVAPALAASKPATQQAMLPAVASAPASVAKAASAPVETVLPARAAAAAASAAKPPATLAAASSPRPAASRAGLPPDTRRITPPTTAPVSEARSTPPAAYPIDPRPAAGLPASRPRPASDYPTAPTAQAGRDPREQCGNKILVARYRCMLRECEKPQYHDHPECQQVFLIEERARNRAN